MYYQRFYKLRLEREVRDTYNGTLVEAEPVVMAQICVSEHEMDMIYQMASIEDKEERKKQYDKMVVSKLFDGILDKIDNPEQNTYHNPNYKNIKLEDKNIKLEE